MLSSCTSLAIPKSVTLQVFPSPTSTLRAEKISMDNLQQSEYEYELCEYKEDMNIAFRLNEFVLYELFSELGKIIGSLRYSGLCSFLM